MKKEVKEYMEKEYKKIYEDLNIGWQSGLRNKNLELMQKGLLNSGFEQQLLTSFSIKIINETIDKVNEMLEDSQNKFNFKLTRKEIDDYINKSIQNTNKYIDSFEKKLIQRFKEKNMPFTEVVTIALNNERSNAINNLQKVGEKINLINKGKKHQFNIAYVVPIVISAVLTIAGIIITIVYGN